MVANLRAGNLDGYLAPDPFNQRAVHEDVGFIWMLSKDIWPGHPCCAFAARREMAETALATTAMPLRTDFPLTTDPFKYRLMELVGVYGDALRERSNELWGDGILSAIDCKVTLERKGERGIITIDAKFLHYKEY
jgi:Cyanate lyase C-terminal domain/NMT1-like family